MHNSSNIRQNSGTPALAAVVLIAVGCSHLASRQSARKQVLEEESRALTTAVVDTLQAQPFPARDGYTTTALRFARQDQHIEGLPLQPFDVPALMAAVTNAGSSNEVSSTGLAAEASVAARFAKENALLGEVARIDRQLIAQGIQREQEQNARRKWWVKVAALVAVPLGGVIAAGVFFPVALPLMGRLLGWAVGRLPKLADWLGVVSVRAFDGVVRGIERWKQAGSGGAPTVVGGDPDTTRRPDESAVESLHTALSREMDAADKALVRARKVS